MSRQAPSLRCTLEERQKLQRMAASRSQPKQAVERARIILACLQGHPMQAIARQLHTRPNTVAKWRQRFASHGLAGLGDLPRRGRTRH